jgi:pyridoxine/pyridoxamine 5'-phosphate oxidase
MSISIPMKTLQETQRKAISVKDPCSRYCTLATLEESDLSQIRLRTLVVRDITEEACLLFVNRNSQKNLLNLSDTKVEMLLFYPTLMSQFRLRGRLSIMSDAEIETHWQHKPYEAKLLDHFYGQYQAQSSTLSDRASLIKGIEELKLMYPNAAAVPFINDALGLVVTANYLEVWQGLDNGIHDRSLFTLSDDVWQQEVLVP